jgi:GntR family transcriptional regulator
MANNQNFNTELDFSVNLDSPIAVYVQIENQIQFAIASGRLKPGDTLPSVREMSSILNVNPNTVTKAYRDLELLQLVHTRRGVGVTVSEKAPKLTRDNTRTMVRSHLKDAVAECVASGLTPNEVKAIVNETIESNAKPYETKRKR